MSNQALVANPFRAETRELSAVADASIGREETEVQSMMVIAKRFPRDQAVAMDRILMACSRPSLAENALYAYARGGSSVTGPSIRLAEAIAQAWGNMQFGVRELDQRNGESTVEAYAWDMECNTRQAKVFQVRHIRHTKSGSYPLTDPRDIYEHVANQGARRVRACILGLIPGDVVDAAVAQVTSTLHTSADTSPEAVAKMVAAFGAFGVTREQIEARLQRRLDTITPSQIVDMKKIYASIRDGMADAEYWFPAAAQPAAEAAHAATDAAPGQSKASSLRDRLRKAREASGTAPPGPAGDTEPGETSAAAGGDSVADGGAS